MKPSPFATATSRVLSASWLRGHAAQALSRVAYVLLPGAVAVDDGRLEQDHDLALDRLAVCVAQEPDGLRNPGKPAAAVAHVHLHQSADRDDVAIGDAHDG